MDKNTKSRWIIVAVVAAVVAAITTVLILVLRARAKKKAWYEQEAFDYDFDDCECFDLEDDVIEMADETAETIEG